MTNSDEAIFTAIALAISAKESVVLATVVRTRGSTPRKAGAKMLVRADGSRSGTICGGCVEAEVYSEAMELFHGHGSKLLSFTLNDDAAAEYGLRCGGQMEVFVEKLSPRRELHIIGAGHIGEALAKIATMIDFEVHVLDDNPVFLSASRFPDCKLLECELDKTGEHVPRGPHVAAVIATRGHRQDSLALHSLLDHELGYLGLVTSQKRVLEFFRPLLTAGRSLEKLQSVAAPVGLDIASETPEEIALAIAAEMLARMKGGKSRPLSDHFWSSAAGRKLAAHRR